MKKEIPILFTTEMVQAILAGRKTQTRRTKGIPAKVSQFPNEWHYRRFGGMAIGPHTGWKHQFLNDYGRVFDDVTCPYGKPDDLLWVRETLYQNGELGISYVADKKQIAEESIPEDYTPYRDYAHCNVPAIHMQKSVARIWLEVTGVRVERLQEVSERDAIAEGVNFRYAKDEEGLVIYDGEAKRQFESLWQSINGEESWNQNPWVWVIEFKVLSTTGKPINVVTQE